MSLRTSIVGVQVKHIKGALQYLSKIGEQRQKHDIALYAGGAPSLSESACRL